MNLPLAPPRRACVYCGFPALRVLVNRSRYRVLPACVAHVDLLALDPAYELAAEVARVVYPALELDRAPSSHRREGLPSPSGPPLAHSREVS